MAARTQSVFTFQFTLRCLHTLVTPDVSESTPSCSFRIGRRSQIDRFHLWATNLPGGTRAVRRSDAAQTRRLLKAATKNDRKQRRLEQSTASNWERATSTAKEGKSQSSSSTSRTTPEDAFQ